MLRQVDISRKLGMSYEVPIAYGAVVLCLTGLILIADPVVALGAAGVIGAARSVAGMALLVWSVLTEAAKARYCVC